jgi:hypothetical protein
MIFERGKLGAGKVKFHMCMFQSALSSSDEHLFFLGTLSCLRIANKGLTASESN